MGGSESGRMLAGSVPGMSDAEFVTPRPDQGSERAVVYLDEGEVREQGSIDQQAADEAEQTTDQSSQGGTETGSGTVPDTGE